MHKISGLTTGAETENSAGNSSNESVPALYNIGLPTKPMSFFPCPGHCMAGELVRLVELKYLTAAESQEEPDMDLGRLQEDHRDQQEASIT